MSNDDSTTRSISRRRHLKLAGAAGVAGLMGLAGCTGGGDGGDGGDGGSDGGGGSTDTQGTTTGDTSENVITLGGSLPLTGASASTGQNYRIGYEAAVQKINEMGGVPVGGTDYQLELNIQDDETNPDRGQSIIQKQINQDGIDWFLSSFGSSIVLPQTSVANANEKMMVQGGGGSDQIFTQGWEWVVGMFPRATRQNRNGGNYYRKFLDPGPETVSIIYENDPFSKFKRSGWETELTKENGPEIAGQHEIPRETTSFSSVLTRVENEDPDLLVLATHADNSQQIMNNIVTRKLNFEALDIGLGPHQPGFQNALSENANYINTSTYWTSNLPYGGEVFETAEEFETYIRDNYPDSIPENAFDYHIATGALCVVVYYHGFKKTGSLDSEGVRQTIRNLQLGAEECFYGPVEFTEDGDGDATKMGSVWQQMLDGRLEVVYPENAQTADPVYPIPTWSER
jgi:branched-chain amino acid transport system substrate-binding protein